MVKGASDIPAFFAFYLSFINLCASVKKLHPIFSTLKNKKMKYYKLALANYATFTGRSTRSEYWYFVLFNVLFAILAMIIDRMLGFTFGALPYGFVYMAYGLAMLLPGLAAAVRRLHDVGKSGWMMLVALIPFIGAIWLLVLLCLDSQPGENKWGPNPNEVETFSFEEGGQGGFAR